MIWFHAKQVFDEDIGDDKRLGVAKLPLVELQASGKSKEIELRLLPSLDMLKIKDKKDRGSLVVQACYFFPFVFESYNHPIIIMHACIGEI